MVQNGHATISNIVARISLAADFLDTVCSYFLQQGRPQWEIGH
jgi:hypothetical protein